jgi:hypothetical protein
MISEPIACSVQSVYPSYVKNNTLYMEQNELPLDPRHIGVPSGASKKIFQPMLHSAQTMHLSCAEINTVSNGPKWASIWLTSHRSTIGGIQNDFLAYGTFGTNRAPILRWDYHYLQTDWNERLLDPHHLRVRWGVPKTVCKPIACLAQTVHLSCVKIHTISKWIQMSFHLTHITKELHQMRP